MRFLTYAALLLGLVTMPSAQSQDKPAFPPPAPAKDTSQFGTGIQRTMTLLATSTPQHRNTVRILFYGQSITEQKWWKEVADSLRRRFPHADLVIENRAIGGFASQLLVKTAESDLYPFYPDLLIFHVYGSHLEYENIISRVRKRTTAEILMQTDHVTRDEELTEETDRNKLGPRGAIWPAFMNQMFLPDTAKKYSAELLDQRSEWKTYLQAHHLKAAQLLMDGVHLNDYGCYLMAELVKPHLRYRPELPKTAWKNLVRDYRVGKEINWKKGTLRLEFEGNRVDVLARAGGQGETAEIRIDGKKPSEFPELYTCTRTTNYPGTPWPGAMRIAFARTPVLEEWTLRFLTHSDDLKQFTFSVRGSQTGEDGEGSSDKKFVSKSGRVVIEPDDWSLSYAHDFTKKPMPEGFQLTWKVLPQFVDTYTVPAVADPTHDTATTLAQGLPNGRHTLEIVSKSGKPLPLHALRVYSPPLR